MIPELYRVAVVGIPCHVNLGFHLRVHAKSILHFLDQHFEAVDRLYRLLYVLPEWRVLSF